MASWFTDTILPEVRSFGSGLKDRVREQASRAALALRETSGGSEASKRQCAIVAQDAQANIESEASRLSQPQQAAEVLERWLSLFQTPERRYIDKEDGERTCPRELSFRQIFLRSRALELTVDSCTRTPLLRNSLRNYALPPPASWPEYCPEQSLLRSNGVAGSHAVAFARAFVALLLASVGPPEVWLSLLSTILSQEQAPSAHAGDAEEPCHMWLVQLLASRRLGWEAAGLPEREAEVQALEETAKSFLESIGDDSPEASSSLAELLPNLARRSTALAAAERAWERRRSLSAELSRAAAGEASRRDDFCNCAASVAAAAQSLASSLAAADGGHEASFAKREELGAKSKELREKLERLSLDAEQLQAEIQVAETRQKELLKQLQDNKEHLENLKRLRAENRKEEDSLRHSAHRAEGKLAKRLADEDKATERAQASRALVDAVASIATSMKNGAAQEQPEIDNFQAELKLAAEQSRLRAGRFALELAAQEVHHLRLAAEVATATIAVAESDSDDLEAVLRQAFSELQRCCGQQALAETLAGFLEVQDDKIFEEESQEVCESGPCVAPRARAEELRHSLAACRERRDILKALLPAAATEPDPDGGPWEVVNESSHTDVSTVDAFLRHPTAGSSQAPGAQEKIIGSGTGGFRNLFGLAWPKTAGSGSLPPDDPFLLEGTEAGPAAGGEDGGSRRTQLTGTPAADGRASGSFI